MQVYASGLSGRNLWPLCARWSTSGSETRSNQHRLISAFCAPEAMRYSSLFGLAAVATILEINVPSAK